MENTERATTSKMEINDTSVGCLSGLELDVKLKSFYSLCVDNKINNCNAFEMDINGYFKLWLERKKNTQCSDVQTFQEISDFLESSEKLYKFRINNLTTTAEAMVEKHRVDYDIEMLKEDNEDEIRQMLKPKRSRLMLTTPDKLNYTSAERKCIENKIKLDLKMNFNKLFTSYSRPSNYMLSEFSSSTLEEEIKKFDIKGIENRNENIHLMTDLQKKIKEMLICPEFDGFIADHDKIDSEEAQLEGIEYRFDPNDNKFIDLKSDSDNDNSTCDEIGLKVEDSTKETGGLLECIDGVNRDYSYFNPIALTKWKEPKSQSSKKWKVQAIAKAQKSSKSSKKNEIVYDTDEYTAEKTMVLKRKKECSNVKNDKTNEECNIVNNCKIIWKTMSEIDTFLLKKMKGSETINTHKWNKLSNIQDTKSIIVDPTYKLTFLQYKKVVPHWWSEINETDNNSISTPESPMSVRMAPMDKEQACQLEKRLVQWRSQKISTEVDEENGCQSHIEEDDSSDDSEMEFDIVGLKDEIYAIINQECVETNSESEWSSKLSFLTLLQKLRVLEREELSIAQVFVGLLHLVNEHRLKLFEEPATLDKEREVYIAKPMNN